MIDVFDRWGMSRVINAIGYATPLGNGRLDEEVIEAMAEASRHFVSIAQLQRFASGRLAEITHAEAGYVVSGASAGLALATAACIAGLDPMIMNNLPHVDEAVPSVVVVHRAHRYDYDHAIRQAGARFREVGFPDLTFPYELEGAIRQDTAAVMFRGDGSKNVVPLPEVVRIAHDAGVPVIVDAALTVPPVENLWKFVDAGVDLVAFSGGKAIGGPPASGFVVGRKDLITSIALQHQDMDVRVETWDGAGFSEMAVERPPYQGIGRAMKVGKEQIAGLLVALERYVARDHAADMALWQEQIERIRTRLGDRLPEVAMTIEGGGGSEPYVPQLRIDIGTRDDAARVWRRLALRDPAVFCHEGALWSGSLIVVPSCVRPGEEDTLIAALAEEIAESGR